MPRQDVPYPGRDNCSWKCKLKEIWDALQGKLHSVNGVEGDGAGNVKIVSTTPQTLSITNNPSLNQIELAATGGSAEDVVKSVNGELPDQDGDVTLDVGVKTINSITPDSDGDFEISAGANITLTPGAHGIEIAAAGGGGSSWVMASDINWENYKQDSRATKDLYITVKTNAMMGETFIPKGFLIDNFVLDIQGINSSGNLTIYVGRAYISNCLNNASTVQYNSRSISIDGQGNIATSQDIYSLNKITNSSSLDNGVRLYYKD